MRKCFIAVTGHLGHQTWIYAACHSLPRNVKWERVATNQNPLSSGVLGVHFTLWTRAPTAVLDHFAPYCMTVYWPTTTIYNHRVKIVRQLLSGLKNYPDLQVNKENSAWVISCSQFLLLGLIYGSQGKQEVCSKAIWSVLQSDGGKEEHEVSFSWLKAWTCPNWS